MSLQLATSAFTIWFTGLSGAGKTTVAGELNRYFSLCGLPVCVLDGDLLREGLCSDLTFSLSDRSENIRRTAEVASILNKAGVIVLVALISPLISDRKNAKKIITSNLFVEVYMSTALDVCEKRDVKGLYSKARSKEINDFTGISSPYEPPEDPSIIIDTSRMTAEEACAEIVSLLQYRFMVM